MHKKTKGKNKKRQTKKQWGRGWWSHRSGWSVVSLLPGKGCPVLSCPCCCCCCCFWKKTPENMKSGIAYFVFHVFLPFPRVFVDFGCTPVCTVWPQPVPGTPTPWHYVAGSHQLRHFPIPSYRDISLEQVYIYIFHFLYLFYLAVWEYKIEFCKHVIFICIISTRLLFCVAALFYPLQFPLHFFTFCNCFLLLLAKVWFPGVLFWFNFF